MADLHAEAMKFSGLIDDALDTYRKASEEEALREFQYRKARAKAWQQTSGTAKEREDAVNDLTADERYHRDVAASSRQGAVESLRSRRQQLSAVQSLLSADRAEAEISNYGPDVGTGPRAVPPPVPHPAEGRTA